MGGWMRRSVVCSEGAEGADRRYIQRTERFRDENMKKCITITEPNMQTEDER
jgi:hypothetical protein